MKIAVLSDIHGNLQALEAVLNEAYRIKIEHLLILGDLVGYYYHPDKVIELLTYWSKDIVRGNHEIMLLEAKKDPIQAEFIERKYGKGINIALSKLNEKIIYELTNYPDNKTVYIDKVCFNICHGSPWDPNFYLYPDSPVEILDQCIVTGVDFILMGHTHYSFVYQKNGTVIVNPGSVGQARDKGGLASWVYIDTSNHVIVMKHTKYDPTDLINEVKQIDPEIPYLCDVLIR